MIDRRRRFPIHSRTSLHVQIHKGEQGAETRTCLAGVTRKYDDKKRSSLPSPRTILKDGLLAVPEHDQRRSVDLPQRSLVLVRKQLIPSSTKGQGRNVDRGSGGKGMSLNRLDLSFQVDSAGSRDEFDDADLDPAEAKGQN
jgi:hypothetical protein